MTQTMTEEAQFETLSRVAQALVQGVTPQIEADGTFMPIGGLLVAGPQVLLVNVQAQGDVPITPDMLMPGVHKAIQNQAKQAPTEAVATCTPAKIDLGQGEVSAIKVVAEHRAGLCAAFHVPWSRTEGGAVQMLAADAEEADAEIPDWR